jgi:hypothetical protein
MKADIVKDLLKSLAMEKEKGDRWKSPFS